MEEFAIRVEHLTKAYTLQHKEKYKTLSAQLTSSVRSLVTFSGKSNTAETFKALDDVSFTIQRGERVGILGRNGAGKSTLLKVLSRIVHPTEGRIEINGRMASLLEVGTGFHPELSGRENIYLNGSILGMTRSEINARFDEIVAFSEIERFLDTPVKRYSSGMYVRLAFAVAAHLEPEILVVDEVLAVGDAEFQKKCLGKMKDVAGGGRTVLFVSHNLAAIQNLCDQCIYLRSGQLVNSGPTQAIVQQYVQSSAARSTTDLTQRRDRSGNGALRFISFSISDVEGNTLDYALCGEDMFIQLKVEVRKGESLSSVRFSVGFDDQNGVRVMMLGNDVTNQLFDKIEDGAHTVRIRVPRLALKPGEYYVTLFAEGAGEILDWIQEAVSMQVEAGDYYKTGKLPPESQGVFYHDHSFRLDEKN